MKAKQRHGRKMVDLQNELPSDVQDVIDESDALYATALELGGKDIKETPELYLEMEGRAIVLCNEISEITAVLESLQQVYVEFFHLDSVNQ